MVYPELRVRDEFSHGSGNTTVTTTHLALTHTRLPSQLGLVLIKSQGKFGLFEWMVAQVRWFLS
jgi:hypothetical protein